MNDYTNIAQGITTILGTIPELQQVLSNEPKELKIFPSAVLLTRGHRDIPHDTAANRRNYIYNIRIYYRADVLGDAENILRDVVDKVIMAIEADVTLGNTCDFASATDGDWDFVTKQVPLRVAVLTISATVRRHRI